VRAAGHVERAADVIRAAGLTVAIFDDVEENPSGRHVAAGVSVARDNNIDFLVGLGGGSAMDCAKGINFIFTNGGEMKDYWGVGKAKKPMLPMIAIPTTAGTGSEAQSFALIRDPDTHVKMACGDKKALCRAAILDPDLTRTQPPRVAAAAGIDAVSHAVETAATTKRTKESLGLSREAWTRLNKAFERAMRNPSDDQARADMLLGAHLAGAAIEQSMLGAAHACANPLTRHFGITHGVAVGAMLPHVVRFNAQRAVENPYAVLMPDAEALTNLLEGMMGVASLPRRLSDLDVPESALHDLATEAATQWTMQFNPVPLTAEDLKRIYESAY
jgi:alcohol dehydrogenase